MLPAVCRILSFMLKEQKKGVDDPLDLKFVSCWFSNIVLAATKIVRITDG